MDLTKIILADSQALIQEGVVSILKQSEKYQIIGIAKNKAELLELIRKEKPNIIILDFSDLKDFSFFDLEILSSQFPLTKVLILTSNNNKDIIFKVLKTGVTHYILKNASQQELLAALSAIEKTEKYFCKEVIEILLKGNMTQYNSEESSLTKKEYEIIRLLAKGHTTKEIAELSFISYHTVNTHRKNILRKLGFNNTSELIMYAVKEGIVDTTEYYI